jgi:hypothetical protein
MWTNYTKHGKSCQGKITMEKSFFPLFFEGLTDRRGGEGNLFEAGNASGENVKFFRDRKRHWL